MQNAQKGDLRTKRTRLSLRNALLTLLDHKEFENITVQDIADQAMINRVTFYKHYIDKYALLDAIVQELFNDLRLPIDILLPHADDEAIFHAIVRWLEQVSAHASFYRMILGLSGSTPYTERLLENIQSLVIMEARRQFGIPPLDSEIPIHGVVSFRFIASGFLGVTAWWLEQKQPLPTAEVAKRLHQLLSNAVQSAVPWRV